MGSPTIKADKDVSDRIKQVIVVRLDLAMGVGKIAAQAAHAAVLGLVEALAVNLTWVDGWRRDGQTKVVLAAEQLDIIMDIAEAAHRAGLPVAVVRDRGLTEVAEGTVTCAAVGPGPGDRIDAITGTLRLL